MLLKLTKYFLFTTALTPLVLTKSTIFPFALGKMVFFRSLVELALILFLIYVIYNFYQHKSIGISINLRLFKNPLFIVLLVFLLSLILSTIFAVNPYRAFWGDVERAEGLFGFLHYFAFLGLTLLIFKRKDWLNFFKISLVVGAIIIFYGFLQYFGIDKFPFSLVSKARAESYIGNPAFLGTYMLFVMMFAFIVYYQYKSVVISINQRLRSFWKYFSLVLIPLAVITIFLTGTRGAILGLGVGIIFLLLYFAFSKKSQLSVYGISAKRISIIFLILFIIFGVTLASTRKAEIWQSIPGLNRLVQSNILALGIQQPRPV